MSPLRSCLSFCQLFLFAALAAASTPEQLEALYEKAVAARDSGKIREAHQLLEQAADKGHVVSMLSLAELLSEGYRYGDNYDQEQPADPKQVLAWYQKARDTGTPDGLRTYATLQISSAAYSSDKTGVPADMEAGIRTLEQLAAQGDAGAMSFLGVIHYTNDYGRRNPLVAYKWYQQLEATGKADDHARRRTEALRRAIDTPLEEKRAQYQQQLAQAARLRHPWQARGAALGDYLSLLQDSGMTQAQIEQEAGAAFDALVGLDFYAITYALNNRELRAFLNQRLSDAQRAELQVMRRYSSTNPNSVKPRINFGEGWSEPGAAAVVTQMPARAATSIHGSDGARELYNKALAANREKKSAEASRLFKEAADKGNRAAQGRYAVGLFNGEWGAADYPEARRYYKLAADAGDMNALFTYGQMLAAGRGGAEDKPAGQAAMEKAAPTSALLAARMAIVYEYGETLPRDVTKALEWYEKSLALGSKTTSTAASIERLRKAAATTQAQKRAAYRTRLAAAATADNPSKARGDALFTYLRDTYDAGPTTIEAVRIIGPELRELLEADFYAVHEALRGTYAINQSVLRRAFEGALTRQQVSVSNDIVAKKADIGIRPGQGWSQAFPRPAPTVARTAAVQPKGYRVIERRTNNFRKDLIGHWEMSLKFIGQGGGQQSMEARFDAVGQGYRMVGAPFGKSPQTHAVNLIENRGTYGGSWFKVVFTYGNMRLDGTLRKEGGVTGEVYDTRNNQHIGNWEMYLRTDLDYYALAREARRANNDVAAIHYYGEAIKFRRNVHYFNERAGINYRNKDYPAVVADMNALLKIDAKNSQALFNRMMAYYYNRDHELALADADAFIAMAPKHDRIGEAHFFRGDVLWWLKRNEDAEKAYETAVALDPKMTERTRASSTREGYFAAMAESSARINEVMNRLGDATAKSAAELAAANQQLLAANQRLQGTGQADGQAAAATPAVAADTPIAQNRVLYAALVSSLNDSKNRKNVALSDDQTAALAQVGQLIPLAAQQDTTERQQRREVFSKDLPGGDAFTAGNRAYNEKQYAEAIRQWEAAAAQGNTRAMNFLASHIYAEGIEGVIEANPARAIELTQQSAAAGNPDAYSQLALIYDGQLGMNPDRKQGMHWAAKAYENGDRYSGYLLYLHTRQLRVAETRALTLRTPNSAEAKAAKAEDDAAVEALRDSALRGESGAILALANYHYLGRMPGLRAGFGRTSRSDLNLPLARFWYEQYLAHNKRTDEATEKNRTAIGERIAEIDAALALAKGRQWEAEEIVAALEAGTQQDSLAYLINREGASLPRRNYNRMVATEAWKKVQDYGSLSMAIMMHIQSGGADDETRTIAQAAIAERKHSVKAGSAPQDTPEVRKRYAQGDPAAAYELYQALNAKHPHGWPESEPQPAEVREKAVAKDYAPAQHLRIQLERLEYNTDKSKRDHARMIQLLRTSAEAADAEAAATLARHYLSVGKENGARRNLFEAEYWYTQAAALAWPDQFKSTFGGSPETHLAQLYGMEVSMGMAGSSSLPARNEATWRWAREMRKRGGVLKEIADEKIAYYATRDGGNYNVEPQIAALPPEQPAFEERELARLEAQAKRGDAASQLILAQAYAYGTRGLRQRDDLAVELYGKAAAQGNADAMQALSEHYEKGYGTRPEPLLAAQWKLRAEGRTPAPGQAEYMAGDIARRDTDLNHLALDLLRASAQAGYPDGMHAYANSLNDKKYGEPDPAASFEWMRKAARAGNRSAMTSLIYRYRDGKDGAPKDEAQSFHWLEKGAEAGDRTLMGLAASYYRRGSNGAPKDLQKSLYWYQQLAATGDSSAERQAKAVQEEIAAAK